MIHIFFRTTLKNKFNNLRPIWFNYEKCFKNLLDTLTNECKLTIMFDGTEKEYYESYLFKYKDKFKIQFLNANSDENSGIMTFEYIKGLNHIKNNDLIMIQENDYLFRQDWPDAVLNVFTLNINNDILNTYLSLYDHLDKLTRNIKGQENNEWGMYSNLKSQIYLSNYGYLRTVPSTCSSFLMSKQLFDKDYSVISMRKADNERFYILGQEPYNRTVLSFMPGFSTHLHTHFMSPFVNWGEINEKTKLL